MKWEAFKEMVDKKLQEPLTLNTNPEILYIDFNESIEPGNIDNSGFGLMILKDDDT